jgi:ABC-2 type transport system permease protein
MRKLWAITKREYLERVRSKWFLIASVFGPILFGGLMFLPPWIAARASASASLARIIVLDASDTGLGKRIAAELNGGIGGDTSRTLVREIAQAQLAAAESAATQAVIRRQTRGYLVIDSSTVMGREAHYAGINASAYADMQELLRVVREQVLTFRLERAGVDPAQAVALTKAELRFVPRRITNKGRAETGRVSVLFAFSVSVLLYLSIFIYGQNVLRGVMEEKQTRVAEVVISSVPATKLLAGKVLGVGAVGLTQLLIWVATSLPDGAMARLLSVLPFSAPIVMPLRMSIVSVPAVSMAMSLASLIGGCYVAVFVAARIYRVGLLMYGKRPSLREVLRWVGYAQ